jgi:DHA1 family bicyclomycin/chloramphenicol resistance-like MFS transporter
MGTTAGAALVVAAASGIGGLATVLASLWLLLASAGLVMPNAPALAMTGYGESAGTAAALLGSVQFGVGALAAPLVGVLGTGSLAMGVVVAGCMVAATAVMLLVVRPSRLATLEAEPIPGAVEPAAAAA